VLVAVAPMAVVMIVVVVVMVGGGPKHAHVLQALFIGALRRR
jgi:hypothetical protein